MTRVSGLCDRVLGARGCVIGAGRYCLGVRDGGRGKGDSGQVMGLQPDSGQVMGLTGLGVGGSTLTSWNSWKCSETDLHPASRVDLIRHCASGRCRAKSAHTRQSRPDSGLGLQVKDLETV